MLVHVVCCVCLNHFNLQTNYSLASTGLESVAVEGLATLLNGTVSVVELK